MTTLHPIVHLEMTGLAHLILNAGIPASLRGPRHAVGVSTVDRIELTKIMQGNCFMGISHPHQRPKRGLHPH